MIFLKMTNTKRHCYCCESSVLRDTYDLVSGVTGMLLSDDVSSTTCGVFEALA